jgi:Inhibitor of Apoptosis domain
LFISQSPITNEAFARNGFLFISAFGGYHVKCNFCRRIIPFYSEDEAWRHHLNISPECPLLTRRDRHNIPTDAELFEQSLPPPPPPQEYVLNPATEYEVEYTTLRYQDSRLIVFSQNPDVDDSDLDDDDDDDLDDTVEDYDEEEEDSELSELSESEIEINEIVDTELTNWDNPDVPVLVPSIRGTDVDILEVAHLIGGLSPKMKCRHCEQRESSSCNDSKSGFLLLPCRHIIANEKCIERLNVCSTCNEEIKFYLEVFIS